MQQGMEGRRSFISVIGRGTQLAATILQTGRVWVPLPHHRRYWRFSEKYWERKGMRGVDWWWEMLVIPSVGNKCHHLLKLQSWSSGCVFFSLVSVDFYLKTSLISTSQIFLLSTLFNTEIQGKVDILNHGFKWGFEACAGCKNWANFQTYSAISWEIYIRWVLWNPEN